MPRVAVIIGTRPEAIKLAPVVQALSKSKSLRPLTVLTSQHREMVLPILKSFGIRHHHDLRVMRSEQTLWDLSSRLIARLGQFFKDHPVDAVLVQGDTSSALFGGMAAFYHKIPVGHVEAGLRTGNSYTPFPEEMNRRLLGTLATWHFAPTAKAVKRLRQSNVFAKTIFLTGNTVVDALRWMAPRVKAKVLQGLLSPPQLKRRLVLVTCHRRENLGAPMQSIAKALSMLAAQNPELLVLFPVHPNPQVQAAFLPALQGLPNVILSKPLDYPQFLSCLQHAWLVLSDSGGVQEEATALGKPVLVLRHETERPEGIRAGVLKLVGASTERIVRECNRLLHDNAAYRRMCQASDVFGDGHAAERIVGVLERELGKG